MLEGGCDIFSLSKMLGHSDIKTTTIYLSTTAEPLNKTIKHQFLFPKTIANGYQLNLALELSIPIYNNIRPQMSLDGNTPQETFNGLSIDFSRYSYNFNEHKVYRRLQNKKNICKACL